MNFLPRGTVTTPKSVYRTKWVKETLLYHICQQKASPAHRPVWYVFAGMGTQWHGMGRQMMTVDTFRASIARSDVVLKPLGIQLQQLLLSGDADAFEDTVNSFVGIAAIQVCVFTFYKTPNLNAQPLIFQVLNKWANGNHSFN